MSKNEGTAFRRKLFGGFDNSDVIDYIATSSRNWKIEKEALERRIADSEKKVNYYKQAAEAAKEENMALSARCEKAEFALSEREEMFLKAELAMGETKAANEELTARVAELEKMLAETESARSETEAKLAEVSALHEKIAAEFALQSEKMSALAEENTQFKTVSAVFTSRVADLEASLTAANEKILALEKERETLCIRANSFKSFTEGIASMLAGLNDEND
ncbi:MAG: hypothetical protein IKZ19_01525 [Clostridia bacterium]|nr:hypothetical protein [Clostridia bacterium]